MSIVILVGGSTPDGNAEHRYLVEAFLQHFGDRVSRIVTAEPITRSFGTRLKRMLKRGDFRERFARWRFPGGYGPAPEELLRLLRPDETDTQMPGGTRRVHVPSHNGAACEAILDEDQPRNHRGLRHEDYPAQYFQQGTQYHTQHAYRPVALVSR